MTESLAGPLTIFADAAQLSQVFANLISNARDAMPHGGRLSISARRGRAGESFAFAIVANPERFVYFTVEDTGTGMPESVLAHVFEPLFTTKANGGTGLGLSVTHQAVLAHGGHVFAESAVGKGSKFHVFIPTALDDVSEKLLIPAEAMPPCRRVLIVDDEPLIAEGLAELLQDYGLDVHVAGTGGAAIQCCLRFQPELAVVDINLPDIDGFEVAKRLAAECPGVKILFASGHRAEAAPLRNDRSGFIQKPFDIRTLLAAMVALYEGSER
jgi:two-component system cell cycle sensor histidine kinase/response regulator CckA